MSRFAAIAAKWIFHFRVLYAEAKAQNLTKDVASGNVQ